MNYSKKGTAKKQKRITSNKHRLVTKAGVSFFRAFFICVIILGIVGCFAMAGVVKGIIDNAPSIDSIDVAPSGFVTTLYYSNGTPSGQLVGSDANRVYVTLDQIPPVVYNSFIAIEDRRFFDHNGIDVKGILRAFGEAISKGGLDSGASTLTQQLLKNQVFNGGAETTVGDKIERKIQEQYLAVKLEQKLAEGSDKKHAKDLILEYYLNTINLGQNTLGVEAASERYFNKKVGDLTLSEATVIAGITQNPAALNPITHSEANAEKREIILNYMEEQGYITALEKDEALVDDVYSRIQLVNDEQYASSSANVNSYFDDALIDDIINDFQTELGYSEAQAVNMLYRGGLQIYTTQSKKLQKICDTVFSDESLYPANSKYALVYRLSILDKDGEEHNYSEKSLEKYFVYEKGQSRFSLYFDNKEDAEPYVEEYRNYIVKNTDEITGEVINYTLQPQVSFILMNQSSGKVLAMIGGRGEKTASRTLNRATDTTRQPGSTFKILSTYLPALDTKGMTLASVQDDSEFFYPGSKKQVNNWNGENYKGLTTLRDGIVNSMNVVTVKTMVDVTPQVAYDYLLRLGFTTIYDNYVGDDGKIYSDIGYPTALGGLTKGVTNLELTAAFASIANQGVYTEPTLYTKIVDHDGNVLIDKEPSSKQVMKESTAWLLTSAMQDVVKVGTGTRARFDKISMPVAGKTGTTSSNVDTWFVGYTPYYTAGIWSGYDDGNTSQTETSYHKTLWKTVMQEIHIKAKKEYKEFEMPSSIVKAKICTKSGKLAVDGLCDATARVEYFDVNTVPTEKCDVHVKLRICKASGELAGEYCPEDQVEEKVFLIKEETGHTADSKNAISPDEYKTTCHIHTAPVVVETPTPPPITEPPSETQSPIPSTLPTEIPSDSTDDDLNGTTAPIE
ncbi:MAG: penicillin-binding protein [Clostridiales bacterium]|nr:penicillin-binding protein [Clostridiales bacterium]